MAKYANGTNYAKSLDPSSANILDPGTFGGKLRIMQDVGVVTAATTLKSSDYIIVGGKLPTGASVIKIIVGSENVALGTSAYMIVGDEGDSDRYMTTAGFLAIGGTKTMMTANAVHIGPNVSTGMGYVVTGVTDNYIRVAGYGNSCIVSSGDINISIFYTVE
jgi:hypothetical protein